MSREMWWLDYVEEELEPAVKAQMKALLKQSKKDQEVVAQLEATKDLIEMAEPAGPHVGDDYLNALHDKIMAQVEMTDVKPKPRLRMKPKHKKWAVVSSVTMMMSMASLLLGSYFVSTHELKIQKFDVAHQIVEEGLENPDLLSSVMSYQNPDDFFVDVAHLKFEDLNIQQKKVPGDFL